MHLRLLLIFAILCFVCSPGRAEIPSGAAFLDAGNSTVGLLLCHGRGKHPTWQVVDPLRKAAHEKLSMHTLSLQMPVSNGSFESYTDLFPEAYRTIQNGIEYLQNEKQVTSIYLMGHSMGARMSSAFIAEHPQAPVRGLIVAGIHNNGSYPLDGKRTLEKVALPVLDIYGASDNKDVSYAKERLAMTSTHFHQISIAGANHRFEGHENEFVAAVIDWLQQQIKTPRHDKQVYTPR